jgi:hypothetical protein
VISVWPLRGLRFGVVGNCERKFGSPRGLAAVAAELRTVATRLGEEVAAFEAMLLKNES